MPVKDKGITVQDLGAFGMGLGVTVVSAILLSPLPPPVNLVVSIGLGGTAMYGMRKVLDPRTPTDVIQEQVQRDYRAALAEIEQIGRRIAEASQRECIGKESAGRLHDIAKKVDLLLQRHRDRPQDFAAAARTLLLLKKFDEAAANYVKVKCEELFLDKREAEEAIGRAERRTLPMFDEALAELLRQMDQGQASAAEIREGTLEDMLRSLDLIRSLKYDKDVGNTEEGRNDTQG